jgi:hypothetical protein
METAEVMAPMKSAAKKSTPTMRPVPPIAWNAAMGRFVERDAAVVALGKDAVEDDDVEVEVGIQGGAEAVQEGDGADLGVTWRGRAGAAERGAGAAQQDAQHVAGQTRAVGQEGADPLRQGEHPLAELAS